MAKTYTSTFQIRCWKHHKCVGCGGSYAYEFVRKVTGAGRTADKAAAKAKANAEKALARDTDLHPCPTCGLFQPDMIGQRRARTGWLVFWLALIAFGTALILGAANVIQHHTLTWVLVGIAGAAAAWLWKTSLWNPNANLSANRTRAGGSVTAGKIRHQAGDSSQDVRRWANPPRSTAMLVVLLLIAGAVLAAAVPEIVRSSKKWPANDGAYPPVVGPGDQTRIYMDGKIDSIKGYWRGQALARLHEGKRMLIAKTSANQNDWGSTIHAKSSEKHSSSRPWVEVGVPKDASIENKTVGCDITLSVQFPRLQGSSTFMTASEMMKRSVNLALATTGAGAAYVSTWWEYTLTAIGLILAGSIALVFIARGLQRQANPTTVSTADNPGAAPAA